MKLIPRCLTRKVIAECSGSTLKTSEAVTGGETVTSNLDMVAILEALYKNGFNGPLRPDHGRMIWGETGKPGYGLFDRALGAAYLNGLWEAPSSAGG